MKRRAKKLLTVMLVLFLTVFTGTFIACGEDNTGTPVEIHGLEVRETITAEQGDYVSVEDVYVTDADGEVLNVAVNVTTKTGGYVPLNAGEFLADDQNGYIIIYSVMTSDGILHEAKTDVKVNAAVSGPLSAEFKKRIHVGEENRIVPVCDGEPAFTFKVIRNSDNTEVAVSGDGVWTAENEGAYTVSITADYGTRESAFSYGVFADRFIEGLIEKFDESWEERSAYYGDKRSNWTVTDSKTCGIKDRHGLDGKFLSLTTDIEYLPFYVTPAESREYYEGLLEEGYEKVRFYIYLASSKNISHIINIRQDAQTTGFYTKSGPTLVPDKWTEFDIKLKGDENAPGDQFDRGLIELYGLLKNQTMPYFLIDNSEAYNPAGGGDTMTLYVSDIYAIKNVSVTAKPPRKAYCKGEALDVSSLFEYPGDLRYFIEDKDGRRETDTEFVFAEDGNYTFYARPKRADFEGEAAVNIKIAPKELETRLIDSDSMTEVDIESYPDISEETAAYAGNGLALNCTLTSRYGDRPVEITDGKFSVSGLEEGIYYLKYYGTKDGVNDLLFVVPFDIYDGTKPVEVESFAHSDSKYAVNVYYVREGACTVEGDPYTNHYNTESMLNFDKMSPDDYVKLDFDNPDHGLSIDKTTLEDGGEGSGSRSGKIYGNLNDIYYLAVDQSKFTEEGPLAIDRTGYGWYDGTGADLYVYVLPRHSKKYYELYKKRSDKYAFAYTGGFDNSVYGAGQFFGYVSKVTEDNRIEFVNSNMTWNDWVYTLAVIEEGDHIVTNLTVNDYIENYDNFADGKVWSYKLIKPAWGQTDGEGIRQEYATLKAKMFGVTFTQKEIPPADDLGTVLVDRSEVSEADLSLNENLIAAMESHDNPELKLVSRYGNREIPFADNRFAVTGDMEDGLYYLKGIKDGEELFILTIDVYDGTKPVEVESFSHSDSKDAIKVYYIRESSYRDKQAPSLNNRLHRMDLITPDMLDKNDCIKLDFDNPDHGLSFKTMTLADDGEGGKYSSIYGADRLTDVHYLAIDESKFTTDGLGGRLILNKADSDCNMNNSSDAADIYIYILPRHSKAYYELYKDVCDKYAFAYAGGNDNNSYGAGQFYGYINKVAGDSEIEFIHCNMTWNDWVYTHAAVSHTDNRAPLTTEFTIDDFIESYDAFAKGDVWSYKLVKPSMGITKDGQWTEVATLEAKMFGVTFTQKEITPPDNIGTVLVDRSEVSEADLSLSESLSGAMASHDNPELKLVSRYGNKEIPFADNKFTVTEDMEDGLYYLKGIKDEAVCFILTVDIYDGTKPVEVESFGHSDSKDAVSVYYIREDAFSVSGEPSARTYNTQAMFDFKAMSSDNYVKLDFDNPDHGLSLGKMTLEDRAADGVKHSSVYGPDRLADVPCLMIDQSKFTKDSPIAVDNNEAKCWFTGKGADLYIYVLPRHSKEYYELYKNICDKYAFSYTGGYNNAWYTATPAPDNTWYSGQYFGYVSGITDDGQISFVNSNMTWYDWAYTDAVIQNGEHPVTNLTIDEFISHYDAFAEGKVWSYRLVKATLNPKEGDRVMGECATYTAKMFGVTFTEKVITPPDNIGTVLVDRSEVSEADLSLNESLSEAMASHDNPELKLVSRYGNKEIPFADNKFTVTDDMEDGLYYLKGIKDGNVCFILTVDIYDGTKPAEVESFGHSDSKDAVSVYFVKEDAFSVSGEPSARTYNTQAMFDFKAMSSDNYVKLDFNNPDHGLSLGKMTLEDRADDGVMHSSVYGESNLTDVPCLMIDQSKFTKDSPIAVDNNEAKCWYTGKGADLYIYVLPRHSKEYYELYRDTCDKYAFSYTGGYNNAWYTATPAPDNTWYSGQYFGYVSGITEDNQISFVNSNMTWYDWAYTDAVIQNGEHPVTNLTIDDFISHYDAFAEGRVWSYRLVKATLNPKEGERVMGECATYTAKMFGVTFTGK